MKAAAIVFLFLAIAVAVPVSTVSFNERETHVSLYVIFFAKPDDCRLAYLGFATGTVSNMCSNDSPLGSYLVMANLNLTVTKAFPTSASCYAFLTFTDLSSSSNPAVANMGRPAACNNRTTFYNLGFRGELSNMYGTPSLNFYFYPSAGANACQNFFSQSAGLLSLSFHAEGGLQWSKANNTLPPSNPRVAERFL